MSLRAILVLVLLLVHASSALADEFKPAYFRIKWTAPENYDVTWRVPALDENTVLAVRPQLPSGTQEIEPRRSTFAAGASVTRWKVRVPGGIEGQAISFSNLSRTRLDVLARYERADGTEQVAQIRPTQPVFAIKASLGSFEVISTYLRIGVEHILTGFDHLLFVLALILMVRGVRLLLATITAFTLAHSITLSLATLGMINLPGPPVEAIIALSIVFVAAEILHQHQGKGSITTRKPWIIAFVFGLLHGLGFAGALEEVGLPQDNIPLALLFFNVGVEIGQLLFISAVLALVALTKRFLGKQFDPHLHPIMPAYLVGAIASYWFIERLYNFWA